MPKSLYICYFGVREPLVQTQVIPYLRELVKGGHEISLLTFEPARLEEEEQEAIKNELAAQGINWHSLKYHKRFSVAATAWDVLVGTIFVNRFIQRSRPEILHGRAHVAALIGAIARKFSLRKPKLLFDIRGFVPEEYTDAGIWPKNGWLYRLSKKVEKWLIRESDGFVVLTEKARDILFPASRELGFDKSGRPVEVIPCCVDFGERFSTNGNDVREKIRKQLGVSDRFIVTHVGALGGLYLSEELADFIVVAKEANPKTYALFLTQSDPERIVPLLRERGLRSEDYFVGKVSPAKVPDYLKASDLSLSFVQATFATQSRSPTKIPEYLAGGLPVVANVGVGDVDEMLRDERVGITFDEFDDESYRNAFNAIIKMKSDAGLAERCRNVATKHFDLEKVGSVRYRRLYENILNGSNSE